MDEVNTSPTALVAEVDCTADGQSLCEDIGIEGYPTLKYGDPNDLQDYEGGRDFDELKNFADENLKPTCGPKNKELCDEAELKNIEEMETLSDEELNAKIKEAEDAIDAANDHFEAELEKLQSAYEQISNEKDTKVKKIKDDGLNLLKSIKASR